MSEWVYFMHPPRDDFSATMSAAEREAFDAHANWLRWLQADGVLITAGPCLGQVNTSLAIFEAASEEEAQRLVAAEPVTRGGHMRGELRPFRLGVQGGVAPGSLVTLGADRPAVDESAYVAPGAKVIGRVRLGAESSIWYGAVLRADWDDISVGERSNVQDGSALHVDAGMPLSLGDGVTIGHNATLHGCTAEDHVLIGMGAIVLNRARVGRHTIVAAGALLTEGQQVPDGVLVAGVPGKVRRELTDAERSTIEENAALYVQLAQRHREARG